MTTSSPTTTASLFAGAIGAGVLNATAAAVVTTDMTSGIQAALGIGVDDVQATNVTLVNFRLDDSSSINDVPGNADAIRSGFNMVLDALGDTKEKDGVLVACHQFNRGLLFPFAPIDQTTRLTATNYAPRGYTPLYDDIAEGLGLVMAKAQQFNDDGVPARSVTLILTDGANVGSTHHQKPESVRPLIQAARATEQHVILAMCVSDGSTDFVKVFTRMGLRRDDILLVNADPHSIRQAFAMASKSIARASVAAPGASMAGLGGFASP